MSETTPINYAVRMGLELHENPFGPLDMYATIPLDKVGRHLAQQPDDNLDYAILYFPDKNKSYSGHDEHISVIKYTEEYADESKHMLQKASSLKVGNWALNSYQAKKDAQMYTKSVYDTTPGLRRQCEQLGLPYMAILFKSAVDAPEITHATLHIAAYARLKRGLRFFMSDIELGKTHFYDGNAANVARAIS